MLQPSSSSSSSSSSSIDNFDEQKEQLLADRDDALKDTASLKERKLISADVKKERDAEAFRLYDEGLAQLKLGRVSAKQHTPETATSSTTSTGILMCVRVIEGRREVVQRRGVTISPGSTAVQAVEAAVDNAAEWQRLSSLPLTVSSASKKKKKKKGEEEQVPRSEVPMTMKARMKVEILYDRKWWPGSVSKLLAKGSVEVVFDVDKNTLLVQCQDIATQLRSPQGTAAPPFFSKKRTPASDGNKTCKKGRK